MAKQEGKDEGKGQGRAVVMPNGQKRIDFIRDAYYQGGKSRSDIRKEVNEALEKAKRGDEAIPYQIVFAATKTEEDPRTAKADKGSE